MNENLEQLYALCEDTLVELMKRCVSDRNNEKCRLFFSSIVMAGVRLMAKTPLGTQPYHHDNRQTIDFAKIAEIIQCYSPSESKNIESHTINLWLRIAADMKDVVSLQLFGDALCRLLDKGLETAVFKDGLKILDSVEGINREPYVAKAHDLIKGHIENLMATAMNSNEDINLLYEQCVSCSGIWHDALARVFVEVGLEKLGMWGLDNFDFGLNLALRLLELAHEQHMENTRDVSEVKLLCLSHWDIHTEKEREVFDDGTSLVITSDIGETISGYAIRVFEKSYYIKWQNIKEISNLLSHCYKLGSDLLCDHWFRWVAIQCEHPDDFNFGKDALLCFNEASPWGFAQKEHVICAFADSLWEITSTSGLEYYSYRAIECLVALSQEESLRAILSSAIVFTLGKLEELRTDLIENDPDGMTDVCYDHDHLFPLLIQISDIYPYVKFWMAKQYERHGEEDKFLSLMTEAADQNCTEAAKALVEYYEKQALKYRRME